MIWIYIWVEWVLIYAIINHFKSATSPSNHNMMYLWNTNGPSTARFSKTVTLTFDLERWPWTWYQQKGLVIRYTHVKYEGHNSCQSKDMANVKVFAGKQTHNRTDKQMGQKLYAPNLLMQGHKKKQCDLGILQWLFFILFNCETL